MFLVNGTQVAKLDSSGNLYLIGSISATGVGSSGGGSNGNGKAASLIAWYPLNSHTNDMSGSGYNGTSSGCTYQCTAPPPTTPSHYPPLRLLHYTTLALRDPTLRYTILTLTLHYTTPHYTTLRYTTLRHCTTPHYTTLHYI